MPVKEPEVDPLDRGPDRWKGVKGVLGCPLSNASVNLEKSRHTSAGGSVDLLPVGDSEVRASSWIGSADADKNSCGFCGRIGSSSQEMGMLTRRGVGVSYGVGSGGVLIGCGTDGTGVGVISLSFGGANSLIFLSVEREMAGMAYRLFCLMIILTNDMHSCSDRTSSETYSDVLSTLLPSQSMRTSQFVTVSTA